MVTPDKGSPHWYNDQKLVSVWVQEYEKSGRNSTSKKTISLGHEGPRIHFGNRFTNLGSAYMDAHLVPDGERKDPSDPAPWNYIIKMGREMYDERTVTQMEKYRLNYRKRY